MPKKKQIPKFESEEQERAYWAEHDSTERVDWSKAPRVRLSRLKPSTKTISLRLPEMLLEDLNILAKKRGVPYQALLTIYLAERVEEELRS